MRIELETEVTEENLWKSRWNDAEVRNAELVEDPTQGTTFLAYYEQK